MATILRIQKKISKNLISFGSDLQHASTTALLSSGYCSAGGFFVTRKNIEQSAVVFAVRRLIKPTWLNDRDQFLQPEETLPTEFVSDCLVYMLFHNSNLTVGANGIFWRGKNWSLVNHFIPFSENEVNASAAFESDFMFQYLSGVELSADAKSVLKEGRQIWRAYFQADFEKKTRDQLKLNRPDVGWYQIRNALAVNNARGLGREVDFSAIKLAHYCLAEKLKPQVYSLGFLSSKVIG